MNIINRFQSLWLRIRLDEPADLESWRNWFVNVMIVFGAFALPFSMPVTFPVFIAEKQYGLVALDVGIWLLLIIRLVTKGGPYRLRAYFLLAVLYLMTITFYIALGPHYARSAWLVGCAVMAALLFGVRAAIASTAINAAMLMVFYWLMGPQSQAWASTYTAPFGKWVMSVVNISIITLATSLPVGFLLNRLDRSLNREREACKELSVESGKLQAAYAVLQGEIDERKQAEQTLREALAQFEDLYENAPNAYLSVGVDGRIHRCNRRAGELLGYATEELVGRPVFELYTDTPQGKEKAAKAFQRFKTGEPVTDEELQMRKVDGTPVWVSLTVSTIRDAQGQVMESRSMIVDITERKRMEEELRKHHEHLEELVAERTAELNERVAEVEQLNRAMTNLLEDLQAANRRIAATAWQLQEANAELESFAYSVSHDLRAPLRAMDGFSRILLEDYAPQLPPEAKRYLHRVRNNAQQMGQLIDDLLAFSRLGRQALKKRPVAPADLVRQALKDLYDEQERQRVKVSIGDLPPCQADPTLLKQVFVNLLDNALKFTRQREVAIIELGCREKGGEKVYFVKDNGVGFDKQYVDKLFGVFQQLHPTGEYEGTGVGLAIVQRIIHRHGGRIWAEAEMGKGATFYFTIE